MKPVIVTKGKSTQIRYELPHRVHDTKIYPVKAPNGSTIILCGYETGVGILWRGGRPLKKAAVLPKQSSRLPKVNGTSNDAIMIIDSDEDELSKAVVQAPPEAEFEEEEEELDPDRPYPSIIQQLRLSLNTEVLHIAVPQIPSLSALRPAETIPPIFSKKIVFTVACADYSVRTITLPLSPPPDSVKEKPLSAKSQYGEEIVKVPTHVGHQSIPRGVTMTWTSKSEPTFKEESEDEMDIDGEGGANATLGRRRSRKKQSRSRSAPRADSRADKEGFDLLVASHSTEVGGSLKIWRFGLSETSLKVTNPIAPYKTLSLRKPASRIAFNPVQYPKRRHSQLLITDFTGVARVYDPFASSSRKGRGAGSSIPGAFIALFRSTFENTKTNNAPYPPILATRKPILDAAWTSDGRHILALLADGEWGIWDLDRSGPSPPADPSAFSLRGFIGTSEKEGSSSGASSPKRSNRSSLVPMTPNTRRKKEEALFHGSSSSNVTPTRGGISVATLTSTSGGSPEDSAIIWYGAEVYRVPDLYKFWTRTASNSNGNSLPGLGLSQIQDVPLLGESITSISQFDTTAHEARMAIPRDALISTEHRLIISASTNQPLGRDLNAVFAREQAEEEETRKTDQALLARGELDLGGMDRLIESMEGSDSLNKSLVLGNPNPRKVLFASETS